MNQLVKELSLICMLFSLVGWGNVNAAERFNSGDHGLMLHGYDAVSYFSGAPKKGLGGHSAAYKGQVYRFSSAKNKTLFVKTPEKYVPSFGGFCAYGVRMGKKFDIDPEAYEIVDGVLFVMLNRATQTLWKQDIADNINIAKQNWPVISNTSAALL